MGEEEERAGAGRGDERSGEEERRDCPARRDGRLREARANLGLEACARFGREGGDAADGAAQALPRLQLGGAPGTAIEVLEDLVRQVDGQLSGEVRIQPAAHLRAAVVPDVEGGVHGVSPCAAARPGTIVAAAAVPRTFSRRAARARDRRDMTVPIGTRRMVAISL